MDKRKTLRETNPDGYFYLLYLQRSAQFFAVLSLVSIIFVAPMYGWFHENVKTCYHWNFSRLDRITISAALDDRETVGWVILLTFIYSVLAYGFIFSFCVEMANTEFISTE
jgi:hypothetical protein